MLRIFKTRYFERWLRKTALTDTMLNAAVVEMRHGLIDANLGAGILKKRIAAPGRGKRGSTRTLIATNKDNRWFFIFGFEKNQRANISKTELDALQQLAHELLTRTSVQLDAAVKDGALQEIFHDHNNTHQKPNP